MAAARMNSAEPVSRLLKRHPFKSAAATGGGRWTDYLWSALFVIVLTAFGRAVEPWIGYRFVPTP